MTMRKTVAPQLYARRFVAQRDDVNYVALWFRKFDGTRDYLIAEMSASLRELHNRLLNAGAALGKDRHSAERWIQAALNRMGDAPPGVLIHRHGWHGTTYIRRDKPPIEPSTKYLLPPEIVREALPRYKARGTLREWQRLVAIPAQQSTYVAFVIALALAAPLVRRVPGVSEGATFNLVGASSTGKTTALRAASSTWGETQTLMGWNATLRAVAEAANEASDSILILDDMQNMQVTSGRRSTRIDNVVHMLSNGQSNRNAKAVHGQYANLNWRVLGLSTNTKLTIEEYNTDGLNARDLSNQVRLIDIPVPSAAEGGIWDRLTGSREPAELSEALSAACMRYYGMAMTRWLDHIEESGPLLLVRLRSVAKVFLDNLGTLESTERRIAWKFAAIYAAGTLAIDAKILPWQKSFLREVVTTAWQQSRGSGSNKSLAKAKIVERVRAVSAIALDKKRTPLVYKGERPTFARNSGGDAFVRVLGGTRKILYITLDKLTTTAGPALVKALRCRAIVSNSTEQKWVDVGRAEKRIRFATVDINALRRFGIETARS